MNQFCNFSILQRLQLVVWLFSAVHSFFYFPTFSFYLLGTGHYLSPGGGGGVGGFWGDHSILRKTEGGISRN